MADAAPGTETVAGYIEQALPHFRVERIAFEGEGDFCLGYTVNGEWLFRFAKNAEATRALRTEAALLPRLAPALNLPVPLFAYFGTYGDVGLVFSAHRKIEGALLSRDVYESLTPDHQERCARELADFLRAVHSFSLDEARAADVAECEYPFCRTEEGITPGTAAEQYERDLRNLLSYPQIDSDLAAFCTGTAQKLASRDGAVDLRLVHGDLSSDHLLFDPTGERIRGVIDFTDVIITDPALDLMYLYSAYGDAFLDLFLRHYAPGDRGRWSERVRLLFAWYGVLRLLWPLEHGYPAAAQRRLGELRALMSQAPPPS